VVEERLACCGVCGEVDFKRILFVIDMGSTAKVGSKVGKVRYIGAPKSGTHLEET
jgi:hypothetical protein